MPSILYRHALRALLLVLLGQALTLHGQYTPGYQEPYGPTNGQGLIIYNGPLTTKNEYNEEAYLTTWGTDELEFRERMKPALTWWQIVAKSGNTNFIGLTNHPGDGLFQQIGQYISGRAYYNEYDHRPVYLDMDYEEIPRQQKEGTALVFGNSTTNPIRYEHIGTNIIVTNMMLEGYAVWVLSPDAGWVQARDYNITTNSDRFEVQGNPLGFYKHEDINNLTDLQIFESYGLNTYNQQRRAVRSIEMDVVKSTSIEMTGFWQKHKDEWTDQEKEGGQGYEYEFDVFIQYPYHQPATTVVNNTRMNVNYVLKIGTPAP